MRDEDFNRFFGDGSPPDPAAWVILVAGIAALLLCVWVYASL